MTSRTKDNIKFSIGIIMVLMCLFFVVTSLMIIYKFFISGVTTVIGWF